MSDLNRMLASLLSEFIQLSSHSLCTILRRPSSPFPDLVEAPADTPVAGRLVTNPSTSPENRYILNGRPHSLTYAPTMGIELIRELFENCRRAAEILGIDAAFRSGLDCAEKRLPPLKNGKRGQLQEWIEDYAETERAHRHVSQVYSLYPGHDISL